MIKVSFYTIGCKLNQYETQLISERLERRGFKRVDWGQDADLYIINSCTVTHRAAADSRRKVYAAKRISPRAKIVVTGCYAQIEREKLSSMEEIDLVIGNDQKEDIIDKLAGLFPGIPIVSPHNDDKSVRGLYKHTRALIKIQDGCNQNCSYCIIPRGRGRERSRGFEDIIEEIKIVCENGFQEIVLTGVHIGRYSFNRHDLTDLLRIILEETDVKRIRLSSVEVNELSDELIDLAAKNSRICPHFHVPLQSGSDKILKNMNRPYTTDQYLKRVDCVKSKIDNVMVGADVIVGFPGEGEGEFAKTIAFVENSPIDYLHVFSYSDHPRASSYNFDGKVAANEIKKRNRILTGLGDSKWNSFLAAQLKHNLSVLIEKRFAQNSKRLTGLSDNYIRVEIEGSDSMFNTIRMVKPLEICSKKIIGKLS